MSRPNLKIGDKVRFTRKYKNSLTTNDYHYEFINSYGFVDAIPVGHDGYDVRFVDGYGSLAGLIPRKHLSVLRPNKVVRTVISKTASTKIELTQGDIDLLEPGDIIEGGKLDEGDFEFHHCYDCNGTYENTYVLNVLRYEWETDDEVIARDKEWDEMLRKRKEERRQRYEQLKKEFGNEE